MGQGMGKECGVSMPPSRAALPNSCMFTSLEALRTTLWVFMEASGRGRADETLSGSV